MHSTSDWEPQKSKLLPFRHYASYIVFVFFIVLAILFTFPSILHLNTRIIGDGGDNYLYFGYQHIFRQQILQGQIPFSFNDILRFPYGFPFYRAYDTLIGILLGGGLSLFISPVFAYNLGVLLLLAANAFFAYLLFMHISRRVIVGIIGGIIYGFSFYTLSRANGHIGLMFTAGFPFFLYSILNCYESLTKKNVVSVLVSVIIISTASFQYLLFLFISVLIVAPFVLILYPIKSKKMLLGYMQRMVEHRKWVLTLLTVLLVIIGPFVISYISGSFVHVDRTAALKEYSPSFIEYILPNKYLNLITNKLTDVINVNKPSIERVSYVGLLEIVLFLGYLFFHQKEDSAKKLIVITVSIFFLLSLGFYNSDLGINLPYTLLYRYFPFSSIPETSRFIVIYLIPITVGVVLFLRSIKNNLILMLILALLIFERMSASMRLSEMPNDKRYIKYVSTMNGGGVLDIPISYENTFQSILPFYYQRPIVGGSFHWSADDANTRQFVQNPIAKNLMCSHGENIDLDRSGFIRYLKWNNIDTVVVHKNDPEDHLKFYFPECAGTRMQSSVLFPQLFSPSSTDKQQVMSIFFPAIAGIGDTIRFSEDGLFYLDGFHSYPAEWLPIHIYLDDEEMQIDQNWTIDDDGSATLDPLIVIPVYKNSRLSFSFGKNNNTAYSFIKLWYRYSTQGVNSQIVDGIEKIYEDDDAAVFKIN